MTCAPNSTSGWRSRILVQEEAVWGEVLSSGHIPFSIDYTSDSINAAIAKRIERYRMGQGRAALKTLSGRMRVAGDIPGELQPKGFWPLVMRHTLGQPLTSGSGPYTHVFEGKDTKPAFGLTIEKQFNYRDGDQTLLRYPGSRVQSLVIRAGNEGPVETRVAVMSKIELEPEAPLAVSPSRPDDNEPFAAINGRLYANVGSGLEQIAMARAFDLTIANNLNGNEFSPASGQGRRRLPYGNRSVSGAVSVWFTRDYWTWYQRYRSNTTLAIEYTISSGPWSMTFFVPRVQLTGQTPPIGGSGPIVGDFTFFAERDATAGTDVRITLVNDEPAISTAV